MDGYGFVSTASVVAILASVGLLVVVMPRPSVGCPLAATRWRSWDACWPSGRWRSSRLR
jgi:hypothetical protein